jgi:membrane-bound serine protease (ClpP class)
MDANAALVLTAFGILLICAEFCLPGWVVPGVMGGVCLLCGVHRLVEFESSPAAAVALTVTVLGVLASGYGVMPGWAGIPLLLGVPLLCRWLVPGSIQWPAAILAAGAPLAAYWLLRIASRAALNKTLLQ